MENGGDAQRADALGAARWADVVAAPCRRCRAQRSLRQLSRRAFAAKDWARRVLRGAAGGSHAGVLCVHRRPLRTCHPDAVGVQGHRALIGVVSHHSPACRDGGGCPAYPWPARDSFSCPSPSRRSSSTPWRGTEPCCGKDSGASPFSSLPAAAIGWAVTELSSRAVGWSGNAYDRYGAVLFPTLLVLYAVGLETLQERGLRAYTRALGTLVPAVLALLHCDGQNAPAARGKVQQPRRGRTTPAH